MVRLTRAESMARTRERLLDAALKLYSHIGYEAVTVERIVADVEMSRGAFYAHFPSKEAIFLELAAGDAAKSLPEKLSSIEAAGSRENAINLLCEWADQRGVNQDMSYLLLEVLQHSKPQSIPDEYLLPIRNYWTRMGMALRPFFSNEELPAEADEIGSIILLLLVEGPFVHAAGGPKTSRILRLTLEAFLR